MTRLAVLLGLCILCASACKKDEKTRTPADERAAMGLLPDISQGTRCEVDESAGDEEVLVDLNMDGRPDLRSIYRRLETDDVLLCREADLNYDGKIDVVMVFGQDGVIIRDEVDLDFDGSIDIVTHFSKGVIVRQEIDTKSDGIADRVRHFVDGVLTRMEGDTRGDGQVDYWEYYDEQGRIQRIGVDRTGDGRVDHWDRDEALLDSAASGDEGKNPADADADGEEDSPSPQ